MALECAVGLEPHCNGSMSPVITHLLLNIIETVNCCCVEPVELNNDSVLFMVNHKIRSSVSEQSHCEPKGKFSGSYSTVVREGVEYGNS